MVMNACSGPVVRRERGHGAPAAAGPLLSGVLRDRSGGYELPPWCFAALAALAPVAALLVRPPAPPA